MKLYVDTKPDEPMDASTAERFREVEVPQRREPPSYKSEYKLGEVAGRNRCIDRLNINIQSAMKGE